ncbi:MAG: DMT family transporter [Flavobacteriales bacterium]
MNAPSKKWFFLIVLSLIWGSSFILIKKSLVGLNPLQLGALRIIFSGGILFLFGFKELKKLNKNKLKWIAIAGFIGTFFPVFLFAYAETEIDSAIASILNSLVPLHTIILGFFAFKISSNRTQIIGVFIGLFGTVFLISEGISLNPQQNYWYAILVIIASIMYALNVNIIKKHLQDVSSLTIVIGNFAFIMIPAFVVLFYSGFFSSEVLQSPNLYNALFYIFILSLFGTAFAKVIFNNLVQISTPVFASSVTYLMPIVAILWGLLDKEDYSIWQGLAAGIILLGVYLANKKN